MPDQPKSPPNLPKVDPRQVDSSYEPFPNFTDWSGHTVNTDRWNKFSHRLQERARDPEVARRAFEVVKRAAAIDTGAIEGLYEVDRGFTFSVATQAVNWQAALEEKGDKVSALFESQLAGYNHVVDFATKSVPLAEAFVRELHSVICEGQETYWVQTEIGPQLQKLPLGVYKVHPNHVQLPDGKFFAYAPVDLTAPEMHRLVQQFDSPSFLTAHPVVQAAYSHYAFVRIHPFADGNGRVARALASVFTCRAISMPLLVLSDSRAAYLTALREADAGKHQALVDLVLDLCIESMMWAYEALVAGAAPEPLFSRDAIERLYVTKGGYTHEQVDSAVTQLVRLVHEEAQRQVAAVKSEHVTCQTNVAGTPAPKLAPGYRAPVSAPLNGVTFHLSSKAPAEASVGEHLGPQVPIDCGTEDEVLAKSNTTDASFGARIHELSPPTTAVQLRIRIFVDGLLAKLMRDLLGKATTKLRGQGLHR